VDHKSAQKWKNVYSNYRSAAPKMSCPPTLAAGYAKAAVTHRVRRTCSHAGLSATYRMYCLRTSMLFVLRNVQASQSSLGWRNSTSGQASNDCRLLLTLCMLLRAVKYGATFIFRINLIKCELIFSLRHSEPNTTVRK